MKAALKRLEMRVRTRLPGTVRQLYRIARSIKSGAMASQPLPTALVSGCQMCASRLDMLDVLPKSAVVAELGTYKGLFAREILARTNPKTLHLLDIDYSHFDTSLLDDPRVRRHEGLTAELIGTFPDEHFDWIYIDADHSYDGAIKDARASAPKLKHGGLLIFNDFAHIDQSLGRYGVHRAAVDFILEAKWPLHYFAFDPSALYDIALRKPAPIRPDPLVPAGESGHWNTNDSPALTRPA